MGVNRQLRMTVTTEIPRPAAWQTCEDFELVGSKAGPLLAPVIDGLPRFRDVPLPAEIVFRITEIDLAADEATLSFVRSYGPLGVHEEDYRALADWPLGYAPPRRLREARRRLFSSGTFEYLGEFVEEFRLGATRLQILTLLSRSFQRPRFPATEIADSWPAAAPSSWVPPRRASQARDILYRSLNAGLSLAPPRLMTLKGRELFPDMYALGRENLPIVAASSPRSLYSICCIEIANALMARREFRICANERCGRLFTQQEGRSELGGHRSDSRFCKHSCALAQAQREYRRRKTARRQGTRISGRQRKKSRK